jgi:hypothetical protein
MSKEYTFFENGVEVSFPDGFNMDEYMESFNIRGEKILPDGTLVILRIGGLNDAD